jgi:hypothetical protein
MEAQQHGDQLKRGLKNRHISSSHWAVLSVPACFWAAHPLSSLPARALFWVTRLPVLLPF